MIEHTAYKGCKSFGRSTQQSISCTITIGFSSFLRSVLGATLSLLVAFTCGCTKEGEYADKHIFGRTIGDIDIRFKSDGIHAPQGSVLDIFIFNSDSLGYLDSYQRFKDIDDERILISSTGGYKKILIYCNANINEENIIKVRTIEDLEKEFCMLEDMSRQYPFMVGIANIRAGDTEAIDVTLKPMTSEIILRSVSCNFSGTSYEGARITEAKVYLTNVSAQCSLADTTRSSQRFINIGMLNMSDVSRFNDPGIVIQNLAGDISVENMRTDISLLCFQNCMKDESLGSPFTRMVLEGRILGETYYWPIAINRTEQGEGISLNTRHVFDLMIRRKGSRDPDEDIFIENSDIVMEVREWKEKLEYSIEF